MPDGSERNAMLAGFAEVRLKLQASRSEDSASDRAARAVLAVLGQSR